MENYPDLDATSYVQVNINILKLFIYWPPNTNRKFIRYLYLTYYTVFVFLVLILFNVIEFVNFALVYGDLQKMIEISFLLFTNTTQLSKISIFIYYSNSIKKTVDSMNSKIFKPRNNVHHEILKKQMGNYWTICKVYLAVCVTTCLMWAIFPFIDNKVKDKELPFDYYYPYDRTGTVAYPLTFLYQSLGMLIHALTHAAMDSLYAGMMAFVGAQIDILNYTLSHLHEVDILGGIHQLGDGGKSKRMNDNLIYCIRRHWSILSYHQLVESLLRIYVFLWQWYRNCRFIVGIATDLWQRFIKNLNSFIAFTTLIQFGMGGVILCVAMYSMSTLPPTSGKFASSLCYFMAMVSQLAIYCWYGNEIIAKSDLLSSSVYVCDWTDTNREFRRNMLQFMALAGNPSKIFAGYFITLSLNTFGGILRAAWSYFAVLKNVQE